MIISLIYLGLFSVIALYLITLGLSFIVLSYIILYLGSVSILFLFILILIDIKIRRVEYISLIAPRCFSSLKCTLMSFERNYKVSVISSGCPAMLCIAGRVPTGLIPIPLSGYGNETNKIHFSLLSKLYKAVFPQPQLRCRQNYNIILALKLILDL